MTREDIGWRPTKEEVATAAGRTIADVIGPGLRVLFVGINPGLYSGATGHHFARPGNRLWKALHGAGFTPRVLSPHEEEDLPQHGLGITNLVERATAGEKELSADELRNGAERLHAKVERYGPQWVVFLGIGAYRKALGRPAAGFGEQKLRFGSARVWVLPNPSGQNARYQLEDLIERFAELHRAISDDLTSRMSAGPRSDEELKEDVGSRVPVQALAGIAWWVGGALPFLIRDGHMSGSDRGLFALGALSAVAASLLLMARLSGDFFTLGMRPFVGMRLLGWICFGPPSREGGVGAWVAWAVAISGIVAFGLGVTVIILAPQGTP